MQAEALKQLEALAVAAHANPDTHTPVQVIPEKAQLVSLEKYLPQPVRQRATYKTARLVDFVNYLRESAAGISSAVFIDERKAVAILDHDLVANEESGWSQHRAHLNLKETPEYAALLAIVNTPRTQRQILDWLEDWPTVITAHDEEDNPIYYPLALAAIRKIEIKADASRTQEEGDFKAARTALEKIELINLENNRPAYFIVHAPLFEDTNEQRLRVRLSLRTGDKEPALVLRIQAHETHLRAVTDEIEGRINAELDQIKIYSGTIETHQPT